MRGSESAAGGAEGAGVCWVERVYGARPGSMAEGGALQLAGAGAVAVAVAIDVAGWEKFTSVQTIHDD